MNLKEIAFHFLPAEEILSVTPLGNGLINDTFRVTTHSATTPDYVLQRINHHIFRDVGLLQQNIRRITDHIRHKLQQRGEQDTDRKTLTLVATTDHQLYYYDSENYWRMTVFIPGSVTHEQVTPESAYLTGKAFGDFQYLLSDLPGEPLGATIPDFHNMEFRLQQFREAMQADPYGRLSKVQTLTAELLCRADEMCRGGRLHREGKLPLRITHCDTKVNNVLFDEQGDILCVIDLDTTMPGFVWSDFGDFIRTAANTGAEDDQHLERVGVDMDIFRSFSRGYLETARPFLTQTELDHLAYGAQLLTYMQTVRFLTDYLLGDTYYKTAYTEHNYQRTLAQFTLLRSIDSHLDEMNHFIADLRF